MTLTKEQVSILKKQLFEQIKHLPAEQRKEAEKQIEELSDTAIEEMLESQKESSIKIFREIVSGKIPSKKVDENSKAIAVLDIKPVSKGHTVIIPKEELKDIDKINSDISILVDKVSKVLTDKLKPKAVKVMPELKFGEVIINLIPIYDKDLSLESERSSPHEDELDKLNELLHKKEEKVVEVKEEQKKVELKKFPKRIP
jgi:histidine triad (HIT) family protein